MGNAKRAARRIVAGLGGICMSCGADNDIVNQCGCDPDNMPTAPTRGDLDELEDAANDPDHFRRLREQQQWDYDRRRQRGNDLPPGH